MNTIYKESFIPVDIIKTLITDYNSRSNYDTPTMNKADPGNSVEYILELCKPILGNNLIYKSGNFYKHTVPYFPHTDFRTDQDNTINVVIPLEYTGENASLIIFDQRWEKNSVTWCLDNPVMNFSVNTGIKGYPCDYPDVINLTDQPINEEFYQKYLTHQRKECYYGLTGNAFLLKPGSILIFDNKLIHCTSNFNGEKLGLTLRFSIR